MLAWCCRKKNKAHPQRSERLSLEISSPVVVPGEQYFFVCNDGWEVSASHHFMHQCSVRHARARAHQTCQTCVRACQTCQTRLMC